MTLRITRVDGGTRFQVTLRLEGNLTGEWAALLERECTTLLRSSATVSLDLGDVGFIDRTGIEVLRQIDRSGVGIHCRPGAVAGVLEGEGVRLIPGADDDAPEAVSQPTPTGRRHLS